MSDGLGETLTVLVVEDEPKLAEVLCEYLEHAGYQSHWLADGAEVVDWVKSHEPALLVLDLMLPHKDGLTIFREVRAFSDVPVIMATAKVDEIDRLLGLELGADDYVCKPYSPRELIARIRNILRRVAVPVTRLVEEGRLVLDDEGMEARFQGEKLDLTPVEYRLLSQLFSHLGKIYSRAQLMDCIYDDHRIVTDRAVDSHIKNLRKKLHDVDAESDLIRSVYGVGYKLEL